MKTLHGIDDVLIEDMFTRHFGDRRGKEFYSYTFTSEALQGVHRIAHMHMEKTPSSWFKNWR